MEYFNMDNNKPQPSSLLKYKRNQCFKDLETVQELLSHDFKAPLRGIGSMTNWLLEDYEAVLDEGGQGYLHLIQQKTGMLATMLSVLQEYIEVKHDKETIVTIDSRKLIDSIIVACGFLNGIEIRIAENLPTLCGDAVHLEQLFKSIIVNAIEGMDKPHGEISIGCEDNEDFWQFQVTDNGRGITKRNFDTIFKLFYTTDENKREGGGIGLTFAKKIVEIIDGRIWLESELELGTTFFFTLPKCDSSEQS